MKKNLPLPLFMVVGVLGIACSGPLVKLCLAGGAHPVTIAFWRMLFSTLLTAPAALANPAARAQLRSLSRGTMALLALSGTLLALHFLFWFMSLELISTFASTAILSIQPILTMAGAFLFWRERPLKQALGGIALAVCGSLILALSAGMEGSTSLWGCLLAFISSVCVTGYVLCNKKLCQTLTLPVQTLCVYGVCTSVLLLLTPVLKAPLFLPSFGLLGLCVALAVLCTLCGHSVFSYLLRYCSATTVSSLQLGEPIGAALLAFLFFSEVPSVFVLLGGCVILTGILWFLRCESRGQPKPTKLV